MSTAPEWMVDALGEHYVPDELDGYAPVLCICGEPIDPPSSRGDVNEHDRLYRVHVAQALWDAFPPAVLRIPAGQLEGQMPLPTMVLRGEEGPELTDVPRGRVIPSRTTDPATSHAAAREITVRAGTQRAHLLKAFEYADFYPSPILGSGLTDEEAMQVTSIWRTSGGFVSPSSEYSKRCSELREAGYIEPTGETRTGASGHQRIVSRITEAGRKVVQSL